MLGIKLLLIALLLSNTILHFEKLPEYSATKISVSGIAANSKGNAIVETESGPYLLYHVDSWEEKFLGKRVKVTGRLVTKNYEEQSTPEKRVQERVGTIRYLKNAKWKLLNNE